MLLEKIVKKEDLSSRKKINTRELRELGYVVSTRKFNIGKPEEGTGYFIAEVLDEDTKKAASFCYLYSINKRTGVILVNRYEHYLSL